MKQKLNGALVVYEEQDTHCFTIDGTNKEEKEDYTSFHFNGKLNNKHLPQESECGQLPKRSPTNFAI